MSELLDLRAVEARLQSHEYNDWRTLWDDAEALLAHARALRAALHDGLEHMHPMTCASMDGYEASGQPCDCWHARAAAVLAAAQDGPA